MHKARRLPLHNSYPADLRGLQRLPGMAGYVNSPGNLRAHTSDSFKCCRWKSPSFEHQRLCDCGSWSNMHAQNASQNFSGKMALQMMAMLLATNAAFVLLVKAISIAHLVSFFSGKIICSIRTIQRSLCFGRSPWIASSSTSSGTSCARRGFETCSGETSMCFARRFATPDKTQHWLKPVIGLSETNHISTFII